MAAQEAQANAPPPPCSPEHGACVRTPRNCARGSATARFRPACLARAAHTTPAHSADTPSMLPRRSGTRVLDGAEMSDFSPGAIAKGVVLFDYRLARREMAAPVDRAAQAELRRVEEVVVGRVAHLLAKEGVPVARAGSDTRGRRWLDHGAASQARLRKYALELRAATGCE